MKEYGNKNPKFSQGEIYIKILSLSNGLIIEREQNKYLIQNKDDYINIKKIIHKIQLSNPYQKYRGIRYKFTEN